MPFLGLVLSIVGSACVAFFRLLETILLHTRLWIVLAVVFLVRLLFPTAYKTNVAVQIGALVLGFVLMGISWGYSLKKKGGNHKES